MIMNNEFLLRFKEFLGKHGRPTEDSPWSIVERWEAFVEECSECYEWGFYEFDNEIGVRDLLERALTDPKLAAFEQMASIRERVGLADERFRKLLSPAQIRKDGMPWWQRCVLARAGEEYRDDMKRLYNLDVEPC
jgi:hypothetical protein